MAIRMEKEARKASVLEAAIVVAEKIGFANMRTKDIAEQANCGYGTVTLYWKTMGQLRRGVMRAAIQRKCLKIIAVGLATGDKEAKKAPDDLKKAALATLG